MENSDRELQSRIAAREAANEHRRNERFKLISSKRPILQDVDQSSQVNISQVETLAADLKKSGNVYKLKKLKNVFLQGDHYIAAFLSVNGALASLVSLLLSKDASIAVEACKCLINLATGKHKTCKAIIKTAAPYLITFLHGGNVTLQNHSAWALGNLASDCKGCRDLLYSQGLLQALLHLFKMKNPNSLESCTFALSVYTKYESSSNRFLCEEEILQTLSDLLDDKECIESTQFNMYCILFHLTVPIDEVEECFEASGITQKIVQRWIHVCSVTPLNILLATPLLRCIGNLCAGSEPFVTKVHSQSQTLDTCIQLLYSPYLYLRKETMWLLTNLAASPASQTEDLQKVLNHMDRFLNENVQSSISTETLRFVSTAKRKFDDLGVIGITPELFNRVQNMELSNRLQY